MRLIKVAKLGEDVKEIAVSNTTTIQQAIEQAGFAIGEGQEVLLNDSEANLEDNNLSNNDVITIGEKAKQGN